MCGGWGGGVWGVWLLGGGVVVGGIFKTTHK